MKTYRYIWALFCYAPGLYLADLTLTATVFCVPIGAGLVIREFLDRLSGQARTGLGAWSLIALLLAIAAARWVPVLLVGRVEATHHFLMQGLLRHNLLRQILRRPGAAPLAGPTGDVISRFRDDVEAADEIFTILYDLIGHTVMCAAAVAVMVTINAGLTLLVFLPLTVVMLVADRARRRVESYRRQAREAESRVTGSLGELFGSVQAIVLAGAGERVVAHFARLGDARRRWVLKDKLFNEMLAFLFDNTVTFGTAGIFLAAAGAVGTPAFTVGDFALFTYYLRFMWEFVSDVGELVPRYKQVGVAFDRLAELLEGIPPATLVEHRSVTALTPVPAPVPDRLDLLEVRGLTCLHPGTGQGVADVDLTIRRGTLTVITGRVGAGKSTLLKALLGLLPARAGEIRWNGELVPCLTPPRCAYTPQSPVLLSASLKENILLGLPREDAYVARAVAAAVLDVDLDRMEAGLQTQVGARGVRLSGGQVQRAAAARMFVRTPELLVFDDLSSALDLETERALWERLPGATVLAVSHRPEVLARADQIITLEAGRVIARGSGLSAGSPRGRDLQPQAEAPAATRS